YAIESRTRLENIAELTAARNAAENASRAKSEFLSVLSHELRTPLTIVLGYAGMLSHLKDAQSPEPGEDTAPEGRTTAAQADKYGRKITTAANHLLTLINEILDYTSMELGDAKLQKKEFALHDLLEDVRDQFQVMSAEKKAAMVVDCDPIEAFADRGRILQILINLVGNALKFSKASRITLRGKRQGDGYVIQVADNGIGIPEDKLGIIFEAFQQVESADHRAAGGTGLGLAICEKLAVAHGGTIGVSSTLGDGAVFTVTMPASAVFDAAAAAAQRPAAPNRAAEKRLRRAG
ncbi:MAG: HAMP domain-containing sensor histidine kinase, partial [Pseudomonadota bacterium]|nr:HAMP domain-containing sensor histidine kinase [Pseudomonadota bacterium]